MIGSAKVLNNVITIDPECKCMVQSVCPSGIKIDINGLYVSKLGSINVITTILDKKYNVFEYNLLSYEYDTFYSVLISKKGSWVIEANEGFESCPVRKLEKTSNDVLKIYRGWNEIDNLIYEYEITDSNMGRIKRTYVKYGERIFDLNKILDYLFVLVDVGTDYVDEGDYEDEYDYNDDEYSEVVVYSDSGLKEIATYKIPEGLYVSGEYYENRLFRLSLTYTSGEIIDMDKVYLLFFEDLDCLVSITKTVSGFVILLHYKGKYGAYIIHYNRFLDALVASKKDDDLLLYIQFRDGKEEFVRINIDDLIKYISIKNKTYLDIKDIIKTSNEGFCLIFSNENYRDYRVYDGENYIALYDILDIPSKITEDICFIYIMGISHQDFIYMEEETSDFTYISPKYI